MVVPISFRDIVDPRLQSGHESFLSPTNLSGCRIMVVRALWERTA